MVSQPPVRKATCCLSHLSEGYVMSQPPVRKATRCLNDLSDTLRGDSTICQKGYVVSQLPVRRLRDVSTTCPITWFLNPVRKAKRYLNHISDTLRGVSTTCQTHYVVSQPPVSRWHNVSTTCRITWFLNYLSERLRGVSTTCQKVTWCLNHLSDYVVFNHLSERLRGVSTTCQTHYVVSQPLRHTDGVITCRTTQCKAPRLAVLNLNQFKTYNYMPLNLHFCICVQLCNPIHPLVSSTVLYCEHWTGVILGWTACSVQTLIHGGFHQDFVVLQIHGVVTVLVTESLFAAYGDTVCCLRRHCLLLTESLFAAYWVTVGCLLRHCLLLTEILFVAYWDTVCCLLSHCLLLNESLSAD